MEGGTEMTSDEFRKKFLEHQEIKKNRSDSDIVSDFLKGYVCDFEPSETLLQINESAKEYPDDARADFEAIERLALNSSDEEIVNLVHWEAGKSLNEPYSDNARAYLQSLATLIREALARYVYE
jgi:hypothetical protein